MFVRYPRHVRFARASVFLCAEDVGKAGHCGAAFCARGHDCLLLVDPKRDASGAFFS